MRVIEEWVSDPYEDEDGDEVQDAVVVVELSPDEAEKLVRIIEREGPITLGNWTTITLKADDPEYGFDPERRELVFEHTAAIDPMSMINRELDQLEEILEEEV